jgi:hypothetical protein
VSRLARALLVLLIVVVLLGIGLVVVGLANGSDPTYALFWSTGFGIIFMLAFPLASALATAEIARRMLGAYEWVWAIIGFCFPVISIFIVAAAGATKRRRDVQAATVSQQGAYPYGAYPPPTPPSPPPPKECPWCGSMIEHDLDVCPNCAGRQNQ